MKSITIGIEYRASIMQFIGTSCRRISVAKVMFPYEPMVIVKMRELLRKLLFTASKTPSDLSICFVSPGKDSPTLSISVFVVLSSMTKIFFQVAAAELNNWASLIAVLDPAITPPTMITSNAVFIV
ncbi:hypothetical protein RclHR1_07990006 [Rhizophagus clarus]|uniref:Uncharacterized protein n=1 Tax=Rhizophagus clarus TaxID=94130 RepID=A0A2Z6SEL5_9GLOM|nr:hypothetical protein RclHR1_07990006 [Rhizophagus clarus]